MAVGDRPDWGEEWHRIQPAVTSVAAIIAIVLLAGFLSAVDATAPNKEPYRELLEFRVWSTLAAASVVVWILVVFRTVDVAVRPFWDLRVPLYLRRLRGLVPFGLYLALALTVFLGSADLTRMRLKPELPAEIAYRPIALVAVGLIVAGFPVVGMWQSYARMRELSSAVRGRGPRVTATDFLKDLREAWEQSQRCLAGLGVLLATATVATGAHRNTLLAAGYSAAQLPASSVLLYGAFFTVLGLIVYVPLYLAWRRRVTELVDLLYPQPEGARPSEEWASGRARLVTFLGADTTLGRNLTAAAGILAPLATSVLTVFIPKAT